MPLNLVKQGGADALKRQETPNLRHKNCVGMAIEKAVVQLSIEHPPWTAESGTEDDRGSRS
ncbi:hypothetical protein NTGM5_690016 [Candidatus Nitrotoga sp. M5]|nr:hypothetical protein NTGM5_690016 [Candidatus Nitrotoga sp. M5]